MDHDHTLVSTCDLDHSQFATSWPAQPTGDPVPTPERPLLGPEREFMMQALNTVIPMDSTVSSFKQDSESGSNKHTMLLHAIPAGLRDSLIQSTLAYDYVNGKDMHSKELEERGRHAGIYAVGIAIEGRDGAFINKKECTQVPDILGNYARAYDFLAAAENEDSPVLADSQQVIDDVFGLDQACGYPTQGPMLHYLEDFRQDASKEHVKWLAKLYRRRVKALDELECDEMTDMHQGPFYVGCTTGPMTTEFVQLHFESTMPTIPPTNKFLSLTLGAFRYIGLKPYTVNVPILPIWVPEHLPMGERLVTVLASSLTDQGEFNDVQAGSRPGVGMDMKLCDKAGSYTAETTRYFEHNLDKKMLDSKDFKRRTQSVEDLERCFRLILGGELEKKVEDIKKHLDLLECETKFLMDNKELIQENLRRVRKHQKAVAEKYVFTTIYAKLLRSITTRLGAADNSTDGRMGGTPAE